MVRIALTLFALAAAAGPAGAAFMFQFADASGTPTAALGPVAVGSTTDVRVYLAETGGATLSTESLIGAGVVVAFTPVTGPAAVLSTADIFANPGFDLTQRDVTPTTARLDLFAFDNPPVGPDPDGRLLLGTFRFTGVAEGTVALRAFDPPAGTQTITGEPFFREIDLLLQPGTATLTVTSAFPVPCPPTIGPLLLVLAGGAASHGIRRARRFR